MGLRERGRLCKEHLGTSKEALLAAMTLETPKSFPCLRSRFLRFSVSLLQQKKYRGTGEPQEVPEVFPGWKNNFRYSLGIRSTLICVIDAPKKCKILWTHT